MTYENVKEAFQDYLERNDQVDLVKTNRFGWCRMERTPTRPDTSIQFFASPEEMFEWMLEDIAVEVLRQNGKGHDADQADPDERREIDRQQTGYRKKLSEITKEQEI